MQVGCPSPGSRGCARSKPASAGSALHPLGAGGVRLFVCHAGLTLSPFSVQTLQLGVNQGLAEIQSSPSRARS